MVQINKEMLENMLRNMGVLDFASIAKVTLSELLGTNLIDIDGTNDGGVDLVDGKSTLGGCQDSCAFLLSA